jgi:hypothetical protein
MVHHPIFITVMGPFSGMPNMPPFREFGPGGIPSREVCRLWDAPAVAVAVNWAFAEFGSEKKQWKWLLLYGKNVWLLLYGENYYYTIIIMYGENNHKTRIMDVLCG